LNVKTTSEQTQSLMDGLVLLGNADVQRNGFLRDNQRQLLLTFPSPYS